MTVGERLAYYREKKNISLGELSKMTDIPKTNLQRYEKGTTKKIPIDVIPILEKALSLPTGTLMGWDDTPPTTEDTIVKLLKAQYRLNEDDIKFIMDYIKLSSNEREALRTAIEAIKKIKDAD